MRKFSDLIKEYVASNNWQEKIEEDYDIREAARGIVSSAFDSMLHTNDLSIRDAEEFSEELERQMTADATDVINLTLDKKIDLCTYAEESDGEGCPATPFDHLTSVISLRAVDALVLIANKHASNFCKKIENLVDAYNMHDFKVSGNDPYSGYEPSKVDVHGPFTVTEYRNLDGEKSSNYNVYQFDEEGFPSFYLTSRV